MKTEDRPFRSHVARLSIGCDDELMIMKMMSVACPFILMIRRRRDNTVVTSLHNNYPVAWKCTRIQACR
ncbi:hypothetical protein CYMTET_17614 [Cymbomonas tetramitiformis]|uniref:Uncharacterized protein n=1 Tax=Cymbomonas tetramitiformis TaxID=36881 RepID=A0AAE0G9S1_9CHLO|nr:hypothetical protein CYMTET_17614 [Cymbomonas tetramitiformis]